VSLTKPDGRRYFASEYNSLGRERKGANNSENEGQNDEVHEKKNHNPGIRGWRAKPEKARSFDEQT